MPRTPKNSSGSPESGGLHKLNKARRLQSIGDAARTLFQTIGYATVTMEQIAATAKVSKRTLYKYFPVKDAILAHLLEHELAQDIDRMSHALDKDALFRVNALALLAESAAWCERHPHYLLPYIRYKFASFEPSVDSTDEARDMVHAWTTLIEGGQRCGELDATSTAAQLAIYLQYLYFGAMMRWIGDSRLTLIQEFESVLNLFLHGASASPRTCRSN
jgi:AcrR family transcriptional regulator